MKNYNVIYGTILRNLRDQGCFEGGSGISVVDEAGNESIIHLRMVRKVRTHSECFILIILYPCYNYSLLAVIHNIHMYTLQIEDIMGLPSGMCCKSVGSIIGACPWCKTVGVYQGKKTTYPGAITFLSRTDPKDPKKPNLINQNLRKKYKKVFKNVPGYKQLADQDRPELMTIQDANEAADIVLASLAVLY